MSDMATANADTHGKYPQHDFAWELARNLNSSGHAIGAAVSGRGPHGLASPGNFPGGVEVFEVVADGRGRLWRFSWVDGSYTLIFDPGI